MSPWQVLMVTLACTMAVAMFLRLVATEKIRREREMRARALEQEREAQIRGHRAGRAGR